VVRATRGKKNGLGGGGRTEEKGNSEGKKVDVQKGGWGGELQHPDWVKGERQGDSVEEKLREGKTQRTSIGCDGREGG